MQSALPRFTTIREEETFTPMETSISPLPLDPVSQALIEQVRVCERKWQKARARLISLEAQKVFWFGKDSNQAWLVAQLISYVVVIMSFMAAAQIFSLNWSIWDYVGVIMLQSLVFVVFYVSRRKLENHLQSRIERWRAQSELSLIELHNVANDSILPDIHAHSPLSLLAIKSRYNNQIRMASLERILRKEIDNNRMRLHAQGLEILLPPEFAEDELRAQANKMIYKSLLP